MSGLDLYHYYGGDLSVSPTGDLLLADLPTTGTQMVYRRLLTNPRYQNAAGQPIAAPDYLWHPSYGAGLARKVGRPGRLASIKAIIRGQMMMESAVSRAPRPQVSLSITPDGTISASIQYTSTLVSGSAATQTVSFDISP